ncbi:MAG: putative dehydrogenase [Hyphomicrobiaceae bacterium]|jgi:predicted dehydrogenase
MSELGLGIVGVGRHGSRYARHAVNDVDGVTLRAIAQRNPEAGQALATELGCDWHADPYELIARPDIDAVVLVTIPSLLPDLIAAAAAHGKALLVEKPIAPNLEAGLAVLKLVEDASLYAVAGHTLRMNSLCLAMREAARGLGRIDTIIFSQRFPPALELDWLDDPARSGGGNILHTGVHCFDLIPFLTGLVPTQVACRMASVYTQHTEDTFTSTLSLGDGKALASVACSRTTASRNGLIEISGEHGQIVGDHVLGTLYRLDGNGRHELPVPAPVYTTRALLERFVADLNAGAAPHIPLRAGLAAIAVADACYRSAASGKFEDVSWKASD